MTTDSLSREATRVADRAERLASDAGMLKREAIRAGLLAVASALGGVVASALRVGRVARALARLRAGDRSRQTILQFLEILGPIASAASAVIAAERFLESQELARQAQNLSAMAERLGADYLAAFEDYARSGCGEINEVGV